MTGREFLGKLMLWPPTMAAKPHDVDPEDPRCVGCKHPRHRQTCLVPTPRWSAWLSGLKLCSCTYWDARWEQP